MWRMWKILDYRRTVVLAHVGMAVLALLIHFLCLGTEKFNWLEGNPYAGNGEQSAEVAVEPQQREV
ncbi:MAG: light-harvesting antenna LH1, alpha subunit [Halorhodospira sp.]